jgi:hypothetical protein
MMDEQREKLAYLRRECIIRALAVQALEAAAEARRLSSGPASLPAHMRKGAADWAQLERFRRNRR